MKTFRTPKKVSRTAEVVLRIEHHEFEGCASRAILIDVAATGLARIGIESLK